ncbi:MAG: hypothetical protein QOE89_3381, partial [Pseudonocardiales bacterium]|nr:hypothetical protein [Pseudonocardiales bacterium]
MRPLTTTARSAYPRRTVTQGRSAWSELPVTGIAKARDD